MKSDLSTDISGCLRIALALRNASSILDFQDVLKQTLKRCIVFMSGTPPRETVQLNRALIAIFSCRSTWREGLSSAMLAGIANGNPYKSGGVEVYSDLLPMGDV